MAFAGDIDALAAGQYDTWRAGSPYEAAAGIILADQFTRCGFSPSAHGFAPAHHQAHTLAVEQCNAMRSISTAHTRGDVDAHVHNSQHDTFMHRSNIYRGTAAAFSLDAKALEWAKELQDSGRASQLSGVVRSFVNLPLMHSEQLEDQQARPAVQDAVQWAY